MGFKAAKAARDEDLAQLRQDLRDAMARAGEAGLTVPEILDAAGDVAGELAAAAGVDPGDAARAALKHIPRPLAGLSEAERERRADAAHARRPYRRPH